jgi:predicted alpha/beta-fold hydrolase
VPVNHPTHPEAAAPGAELPTASREPYRAPWWLPGGNAQTIWAAVIARRERARLARERWDTPDGDVVAVDFLAGPAGAPFVVLFHGLEGGGDSHYAEATMAALARHGWRGAIPHFRGCGGQINRLPRAYHSGDADEIEWMLERLRARAGGRPLFAVGVSLGGNALLKWLGETGTGARTVVEAVAAISAPVDLMASGDALGQGFCLNYTRHFLSTMKRKSLAKLERFPGIFDRDRASAALTLREFDDCVTAPLHGFNGVNDYWTRASAKPWLRGIEVRTLMVNARNDPFLPAGALPSPAEVSAEVTLEFPESGGHVAFVTGPFPGRLDWLPRRLLEFFGVAGPAS